MNTNNAKSIVLQLMKKIISRPRRQMLNLAQWRDGVPECGGVYVIWDMKQKPRYVGESCNLLHRFGDLQRTVNHTFRRKVQVSLRLDGCTELRLSQAIAKRYQISYLPVAIGRIELEEYLILKWSDTIINKPPI